MDNDLPDDNGSTQDNLPLHGKSTLYNDLGSSSAAKFSYSAADVSNSTQDLSNSDVDASGEEGDEESTVHEEPETALPNVPKADMSTLFPQEEVVPSQMGRPIEISDEPQQIPTAPAVQHITQDQPSKESVTESDQPQPTQQIQQLQPEQVIQPVQYEQPQQIEQLHQVEQPPQQPAMETSREVVQQPAEAMPGNIETANIETAAELAPATHSEHQDQQEEHPHVDKEHKPNARDAEVYVVDKRGEEDQLHKVDTTQPLTKIADQEEEEFIRNVENKGVDSIV